MSCHHILYRHSCPPQDESCWCLRSPDCSFNATKEDDSFCFVSRHLLYGPLGNSATDILRYFKEFLEHFTTLPVFCCPSPNLFKTCCRHQNQNKRILTQIIQMVRENINYIVFVLFLIKFESKRICKRSHSLPSSRSIPTFTVLGLYKFVDFIAYLCLF